MTTARFHAKKRLNGSQTRSKAEVDELTFEAWHNYLVAPIAPYFFTEELMQRLPTAVLVLTRQEWRETDPALRLVDSYTTYAVGSDYMHVGLWSASDLLALNADLRQAILLAQHQAKRGQVYQFASIKDFIPANLQTAAQNWCIEAGDTQYLILDQSLWQQIPKPQQEQWLRYFVASKAETYPILDVPFSIDRHPVLGKLANSYATDSGANCFATALAAVSDPAFVETISTLWIHQEPFLRGIAARGFVRSDAELDQIESMQDVIVVWFNAENVAQHACYVIGDGIALNKNSQAWYAPRHLVNIRDLLNDWQSDGYQVGLFRR